MKKAVLFTHPAGLRARESLKKLSAYCSERGLRARLVEFDDFLIPVHLEECPAAAADELLCGPAGLAYLLRLPKDYLRALWRSAVVRGLEEIQPTDECLLLSIHSVFHNNKSREFFSPVQIEYLREEVGKKGFEIQRVVVLIDDIYDVFRQLSTSEQLFQIDNASDAYKKAISAILNLHLALNWRSVEVFESSQLAQVLHCGAPLILAVKQPLSVAHDMIQGKPLAYVSHPITDVRDDQDFHKAVNDLATALAHSGLVAPLCPTAIDELRFVQQREDHTDVFLPTLDTRWPYGTTSDILFCPPSDPNMNPIDPDGGIAAGDGERFVISGLLEALKDAMSSQVNARDRELVEQASLIVVWRPYYRGNLSQGVAEEIWHRNSLLEHGLVAAGGKPCFVYAPLTDLGAWRIAAVAKEIGVMLRLQDVPRSEVDEVTARIREGLMDSDLLAAFANGNASFQAVRNIAKGVFPRLRLVGPKEGAMGGKREVENNVVQSELWRELVTEILAQSPLKRDLRDGDDIVETEMGVDQFVTHAMQQWSRLEKGGELVGKT